MQPFAVVRDSRPLGAVLAVHGDLDVSTVKVLRSEVEAVLGEPPERLYLDLT